LEGDDFSLGPSLHRSDGALGGRWRNQWSGLACVQQQLVPTLKPGDVVVIDNLGARKVAGVHKAIEAVGARVVSHLTVPISTQSKPSFPNSRRCCARPQDELLKHSGKFAANCSINSPSSSAATTSSTADIATVR
jgi:hypothetical protein